MKRIPLDPREGPTAWLEIEALESVEKHHFTLKFGTDPTSPTKEMTLNQAEFERMVTAVKDECGLFSS